MRKAFLSKSKYTCATQCMKMLWMKHNMPEEFDDSVMNQAVLDTGNQVGDLAMGLFGDFTEIPFGVFKEMLSMTKRLMEEGEANIAEASFSYDGNFCSVDILRNLGNKDVELYEVKSSTETKDIYLDDVSYQNYVLTQLGYNVVRSCIVHINNQYVRHGELDLNEFFYIDDVSDIADLKANTEVGPRIARIREYLAQTEEPECEIGEQCFKPYPCGFWKHCTRDLPHPNIFDVSSVQTRTKLKNYRNGIVSFEDIYNDASLKDTYMIQVDHELHEQPDHIDVPSVAKCVNNLSYPLYFLDFESFNPAIPPYDDTKPFCQIVFQYSLHYIEEPGGELKHTEFLAYPWEDPRRAVAEHLCRDIPMNVCVTAYNMTFEKTRIKELAALYPDLADHLLNINENMQDLMVPFQHKDYYNRAMQGSYSIKYVLPALFPGDPSLDYHNLEGVHNGAEASDTFKRMATMPTEELEAYRHHLLKYCELDTFAMVKIWQKLREVTE